MKRLGYFMLAIVFPWFVFIMEGLPGKAFIAFVLQLSIIGWLISSVWAWRLIKRDLLSNAPISQKSE